MSKSLWILFLLLQVLAGPSAALDARTRDDVEDPQEEPEEPEEEPICEPQLECPQWCAACPLDFQPKAYPKRVIPQVFIGWANGSSYQENGLFGPMLIPIEIASQDPDEVHIKCNGGCQKMAWQGDWTIDWKMTGHNPSHPYPWRQGSFVNPHADRKDVLKDRWAVLYLPPEDLVPGESRDVAFQATIRDLCPEGVDQESTVDFSGTIKRSDDGMWEVSLAHATPNIPDEQEDPCEGSSDPCELFGFTVMTDTFPEERYRDIPTAMYVDEVRALTFAAKDCDRLFSECGIPSMFCSTFCHKKICDEISYLWSVTHVNPQDTGQGVFETFGTLDTSTGTVFDPRSQTVMFTATQAGKLRLTIQANSKSGDATVFVHDLEVFERKTLYVDHDPFGQHPIYLDGDMNTTYGSLNAVGIPGMEWIDINNDGDATDPGDYSLPMAYTKGGAPKLALFAQSALMALSMPGAIITGNGAGDTPNLQFVSRLDWTLHVPIPFVIAGTDFLSFGNLPNKVGRLDHTIRWEVSYVPTRPVSHVPQHSYRLYTTLTTPQALGANTLNPQYYRYWESAYDISCSGAQNATTAAGVLAGVKSKFSTTVPLNRKAFDGANQPDGAQLRYWGDVGTQPYTSTCQLVGAMLTKTTQASNGYGTCQAMAGLFKLCLALHGEASVIHEFHGYLPPRRLNGATMTTFIGQPALTAYRLWFLVKDYNLQPPAGGTSTVLYFDGTDNLALAPGGPATNTDPDRARTFHHVDMVEPHTAAWRKAVDLNGKPAVGSGNPRSLFSEHALVQYGGSFYDPSYGDQGAYATALAYAQAALDGICAWDLAPNVPGQINAFWNYAMDAFAFWSGAADAPTFAFVPRPQY